jgi:hypothetical protein
MRSSELVLIKKKIFTIVSDKKLWLILFSKEKDRKIGLDVFK